MPPMLVHMDKLYQLRVSNIGPVSITDWSLRDPVAVPIGPTCNDPSNRDLEEILSLKKTGLKGSRWMCPVPC